MDTPDFVQNITNGCTLHIRLTPNASVNKIIGTHSDVDGLRLKVSITQQPEDGKANKALIKFLSKSWKIPQLNFTLVSGSKNRNKTLEIAEVSASDIHDKIKVKK